MFNVAPGPAMVIVSTALAGAGFPVCKMSAPTLKAPLPAPICMVMPGSMNVV